MSSSTSYLARDEHQPSINTSIASSSSATPIFELRDSMDSTSTVSEAVDQDHSSLDAPPQTPSATTSSSVPTTISATSTPAMSASSGNSEQFSKSEQFTYFPRLPAELQLKIWKFSGAEGRLVHLEVKVKLSRTSHNDADDAPNIILHELDFKLRSPVLPALHACRQSRNELMGKTLIPITRHIFQGQLGGQIYFNPVVDSLVISMEFDNPFYRHSHGFTRAPPWAQDGQHVSLGELV